MAKIPVVDMNDNVLYYKERSDVSLDEIYRVSACWIMNSQWDMLLAQRAWTKKNDPGKRWPAVAGTVTGDETYAENILHEIPEEIWINISANQLINWPRLLSSWKHKHFTKRFFAILDIPIEDFTKEEWAVEELRRWSIDELDIAINKTPDQLLNSTRNWRKTFSGYINESWRIDTVFDESVSVEDFIDKSSK